MDAKTVADARNFLRSFRSVITFAEHIDQFASLESELAILKETYQGKAAFLQKEHAETRVVIEAQRAQLASMRMEQNQILEMMETAKGEAHKIVKDAKAKAELAMTAKLKDATEVAEAMVAKAKDEASAWDHRTSVAKAEFEDFKAQADAKQKDLADIQAKLEALFAKVR